MQNSKLNIRKNVTLAPYTTFNIGGPADYFCELKKSKDIVKAIQWAKKRNLNYFILGNGSNLLISDKGFKGLVIKVLDSKPQLSGLKVTVGTGTSLAKLVQFCLKDSLSGLESLAGIPGTVGGAITGNAGTKKGSISESLEKVIVFGEDGLIYDLNNKECQFDYRKSRFQNSKEIILKAVFSLKKAPVKIIKENIKEVLATRKGQPKGKSAGSIFKNLPAQAAGFLIEKAGLRGKQVGRAMVSKKHANWIINLDDAKAKDVLKLINLVKKEVKEKFNIQLEEEIKLVGEF
jgi:UDP-N-acetylmuramate dehydrogenase